MAINAGKYVEEVNVFLKQLAEELGNPHDTDHAGRVAMAVFHTLRDRIPVEESFHLISQLPMILKGVYIDGWDISKPSTESDTLDEFLDEIREHSPRTQSRDFGNRQQAHDHVKAVLRIMNNYISEGEMKHIKNTLPKKLAAALFSEK